jgi:hypothetical protein
MSTIRDGRVSEIRLFFHDVGILQLRSRVEKKRR